MSMQIVLEGVNADMFNVVDQVIDEGISKRDPRRAFGVAVMLRNWSKMTGLALAKLLYGLKENWGAFQMGDTFEDTAVAELGISYQTVVRYPKVWKYVILGCPDHTRERFLEMPIEWLMLVYPVASEGLLSEEDWERLSLATGKDVIRDIIREKHGTRPRAVNALSIWITRDGELWAKRGEVKVQVGYVFRDENNSIVQAAVDRLVRGAGVILQW